MRGILLAVSLMVLLPGAVADLPEPGPSQLEAAYDDVRHSVTLAWLPDDAADGFSVYRNGELLSTVQAAGYVDDNLPAVEVLIYEVTARHGGSESMPASVVIAATYSQTRGFVRVAPVHDPEVIIVGYNPCPPAGLGGAPPNVLVIDQDCLPNPLMVED